MLADPPANPDVGKGYLDLSDSGPADDIPKNTGIIQRMWASPVGSMFYDRSQVLTRKLITAFQHPSGWLDIPQGGIALDVGSGPGNVTASLARAAGPDGLALGVDISEPMLARAVRAAAGPQVGFLRADAQRLPFRDATFDAVVSIAMLQLIPKPSAALAEMARVLRPGGRVAVMVPTAGRSAAVMRLFPDGGAYFFGGDEIGDTFEDLGLVGVRTKNIGTIQWVRGKRP
jgi:SAM-dependent methyltransferase